MSTPLDLAIDIAGALIRSRAASGPVNVRDLAGEMSRRHAGLGYSREDIEAALIEEGRRAGLPLTRLVAAG